MSSSATLLVDHPLSETIWNNQSGEQATQETLAEVIGSADYILLGEKHDNPRHHLLQSRMVTFAAASGFRADRSGHVIFEMLEPSHQAALDALVDQTRDLDDAGLDEALSLEGETLEWTNRGWPDWSLYQPIFKTALTHKMSLHGGNPDRETLLAAGRKGIIAEDFLQDPYWQRDYTDEQRESLTDELVDAHCGMLGRDAVGPMITMQRLKDASMARAMRQAHKSSDYSILIAGNGHTRKDRGVPMFLEADKRVVSIAFIEVIRGQEAPANYPAVNPELYDFVWFTPRVDEIDPCSKFRKQLEGMKPKSAQKQGS